MKKTITISVFFLSLFSFVSFCKAQWYTQNVDINAIFGIDFINETTGMTGGVATSGSNYWGKAFYTTNSGVNWNSSSIPDSCSWLSSCISIRNDLSYMAGGYFDSSIGFPYEKPLILKSIDQGMNWSTLCTFPGQFNWLRDIDFINENTGYASLQRGRGIIYVTSLMKTTNAGQTWKTILTLDSLSDLYRIDCLDENIILGAGGNGHGENDYQSIVVKSTDGGMTWQNQVFSNLVVADDITFTDDQNGLFTGRGDGGYGFVYKTTNQGVNWIQCFSLNNVPQLISTDFYKGTGIGLVYGQQQPIGGAFIWKTTDYGNTWVDQQLAVSMSGGPVVGDMVNADNYYLGSTTPWGSAAKILHTTNGGTVSVNNPENIVPSEFRLHQNYPNPFNPTTTIEYSVPVSQLVTIKVFDILGNEVEVLYDGKQNPGTYSVNWNATGKPSGTYFYTLTAGKFSETKKMLVIK